MKRLALKKAISTSELIVALIMLAGAGVLFYAQSFIHSQVTDQLSSQRISFPEEGSASLDALNDVDKKVISQYAGQQLTTGVQAKAFADHYIAAHLETIGGGKTYSELSTESRQNPSDAALAGKVESVFRGQTLRGMLLNAYAFDTMATVALYAAWGVGVAGVLLLILSLIGLSHTKKRSTKRK